MADVNLSTVIGRGGDLIMPQYNPVTVSLKAATGSSETADIADFWVAIDLSHTNLGYESVSLDCASDTTEQTIVDISGQSGILTHVLAPELDAAGIMTVRVTIDGIVTAFLSPSYSVGNIRSCIGHFLWIQAETSTSIATAAAGARDGGYDNAGVRATLSTPPQAILDKIGMKFNSSLKVTVQGSTAIETVAQRKKAAACYLTSIPSGL